MWRMATRGWDGPVCVSGWVYAVLPQWLLCILSGLSCPYPHVPRKLQHSVYVGYGIEMWRCMRQGDAGAVLHF